MKTFIYTIALTAAMAAVPTMAADVGLSLSIGQPGFYGRLDLGNVGRPQVIYSKPVVIQRAPRGVVVEPLYLRVPRSHASNWRRYCARYDACNRPVYFVRDDWYNNVYVPRYREDHRDNRREDNRDDRRDDRRDENRNDRDDRNGRDNDNDRNRGR